MVIKLSLINLVIFSQQNIDGEKTKTPKITIKLLLVVLSDSKWISADRIVDERAKVMGVCSDPLARH